MGLGGLRGAVSEVRHPPSLAKRWGCLALSQACYVRSCLIQAQWGSSLRADSPLETHQNINSIHVSMDQIKIHLFGDKGFKAKRGENAGCKRGFKHPKSNFCFLGIRLCFVQPSSPLLTVSVGQKCSLALPANVAGPNSESHFFTTRVLCHA